MSMLRDIILVVASAAAGAAFDNEIKKVIPFLDLDQKIDNSMNDLVQGTDTPETTE